MMYAIGTGIRDVTGPAAEVGMMGMSDVEQKTAGILDRLYARAFVIADQSRTVAVVVADLWSCTLAVKRAVVDRLAHLQDTSGAPLFTLDNLLICGNHTHSGPGGYSHYAMYNAAILGFIEENFECVVDGIVAAIEDAQTSQTPGQILVNRGELLGCGANRSLPAYEQNPAAARAGRPDTDTEMVLLKFVGSGGEELGVLNWFPIHTTSMGETNRLISADNKGYAEYLFGGEKRASNERFIAAFANSNCGDVSGNVGLGVPDGTHDVENMKRYGRMQYEKARALSDTAAVPVSGPIDCRHAFVDMSNLPIEGTSERTWPAAIGVSMIGGSSEDSTNHFANLGIREGITTDDEISDDWMAAGSALVELASALLPETDIPSEDRWPAGYQEGHGQKPILLAHGLAEPFPLSPPIVPVQIVRIGSVLIAGLPAEITTMAGRRLRQTVLDHAGSLGLPPGTAPTVVVTAYANGYAGYVTTAEEYSVQHYEGASTLFGPLTLAGYQQEFARLATALRDGTAVDPGPQPQDLTKEQHRFQTRVLFDSPPPFKEFGDLAGEMASHYLPGQQVVARFWGGHPKNDLKIGDSYLRVEREVGGGWQTLFTDRDFCTEYRWERKIVSMGISQVTVAWTIPEDTLPGRYRLRHDGNHRSITGKIGAYQGLSPEFEVVAALPTDRLFFLNDGDKDTTLRFYHPDDHVRAVAYRDLELEPGDSAVFVIPEERHPIWGPWEGKARVRFAVPGKDPVLTLAAGQQVAVSECLQVV